MKGRRGRPRRFTTGTTTKPFLMATRIEMPANHGQSMIRKSMPSGCDRMGGNRFCEKIMLKQKDEIMIRFDRIMIS